MTDFKAWIAPPGAVVEPPVHPETVVSVIFSDGQFGLSDCAAGDLNWSAEGDGLRVVAYAVVSEYKPAPRAMKAVWNRRRSCFEIYVTNVDYHDGMVITVFGDLP